MNWIIFGDDWDRHPSTTQHLCRHLPADDHITWINSIGMRTPKLQRRDVVRVFERLQHTAKPATTPTSTGRQPDHVLSLTLSPYHHLRPHRRLNTLQLKRALSHVPRNQRTIVLYTNPVVAHYTNALPDDALMLYLRLDDYANLPGVDAHMIKPAEHLAQATAHAVIAPAQQLLPRREQTLYLPQGVDTQHFQLIEQATQNKKTLGFFGLFASWLDMDLIARCALANPDWHFEFRGPQQHHEPQLEALPNVHMLPAVPYAELPEHIKHWHAAWIPFERSTLTEHVNPLKLREYLAAGLPTASTWMPEIELPHVHQITDVQSVCDWLAHMSDTRQNRNSRRQSVMTCSWHHRALTLRHFAHNLL